MRVKTMSLNDVDQIGGVKNEQERTQDGSLRNSVPNNPTPVSFYE